MTSLPRSPMESGAIDPHLGALIDDFTTRLQLGANVEIEEFILANPAHAEELRRLLPAARAMSMLAQTASAKGPIGHDCSVEVPLGELGEFRLIREIGRGGMGVVYEAEQTSLRRRVALKVLPFAAVLDPRHLQRFKNESLAAATLDHPHIVPVYAVGSERGVHFYAMRFIEGQTVAELIATLRAEHERPSSRKAKAGVEGSRMPGAGKREPRSDEDRGSRSDDRANEGDARNSILHSPSSTVAAALVTDRERNPAACFRTIAELGRQVAEALDHAHQNGVIHRDIKPSNLMLDARGNVFITDFGLARIETGASLTMTGDMMGTLRYMSPEQAAITPGGRAIVDQRTDVYSLGSTLYELLTLRAAYPESDRQKLLHQIAHQEPPRLRDLEPSIPEDLETVVLKALEKNPADRYATARELADDLGRFFEHHPILARRPSLVQVVSRWSRRHSGVVWSAMAVLLVTTAALSVSTAWVVLERDAARRAEAGERTMAGVAQRNERAAKENEAVARKHEKLAQQNEKLAHEMQLEAEQERKRAETIAIQTLLDRGTRRINDGDALGLLDLLEARQIAELHPQLREASGRIWTTAKQSLTRELIQLLSPACVGTISPNGTQFAAVNPGSDGRFNRVNLWNIATGERSIPTQVFEYTVSNIAFSPDGSLLAAHSKYGVTRVWWTKDGLAACPELRHDETVPPRDGAWWTGGRSVTFSPDGSLLATGAIDGSVKLWHMPDGTLLGPRLVASGPVTCIKFSPDGKRMAAIGDGRPSAVHVWETATGAAPFGPLAHASGLTISNVLFAPGCARLVSVSNDGTARAWDASSGELLKEFRTRNGWSIGSVLSSETLLATAGADWTVRMHDIETGKQVAQRAHLGLVNSIQLSPDGRSLATGSYDNTVRLWDAHTLAPAGSPLPTLEGHAQCLFSPGGDLLAGWSASRETRFWRLAERPRAVIGHISGPYLLASVSPDRRLLARLTTSPPVVRVHRLATSDPVGSEILLPEDATVACMAFSHDSRCVALAMASREHSAAIRLFDIATGRQLPAVIPIKERPLCLAISRDGKYFATGLATFDVMLYEFASGRLLHTLTHRERVYDVEFGPDGNRLATVTGGGTLQQWNVSTGGAAGPAMQYSEPLLSVGYSPDGKMIATVSTYSHDDGDLPRIDSHAVQIWFVGEGASGRQITLPVRVPNRLAYFNSPEDLVISTESGRLESFAIPHPPRTLREVELATWVALGLERAPSGEPSRIRSARWRELKQELAALRAAASAADE